MQKYDKNQVPDQVGLVLKFKRKNFHLRGSGSTVPLFVCFYEESGVHLKCAGNLCILKMHKWFDKSQKYFQN